MPKGLENLHIAVIMDGNGRWAKKRAMPRVFGHKAGGKTLKKIITHAAKNHLKVLSVFAFSAENWLRPQEEVSFLMQLLDEYIANEWSSITDNNIKFLVSGNISLLPEKTKNSLLKLIDDTKNNIISYIILYNDSFKNNRQRRLYFLRKRRQTGVFLRQKENQRYCFKNAFHCPGTAQISETA